MNIKASQRPLGVLLLAGIPATGKSTFGRFLSVHHGFAHYDLEHFPAGWPVPGLKPIWEESAATFLERLKHTHPRIVIDWGFPPLPECVQRVQTLRAMGVRLLWFAANLDRARDLYRAREGGMTGAFDQQVQAISVARFPAQLGCETIDALDMCGRPRKSAEILHDCLTIP